MYKRFFAGVKLALGLHHPGRNLKIFGGDVFLVSYPKSGNTWTRFLISNLVYPEQPANFGNINELIPDPEGLSKRHLARLPRPRVIKSHQYFHPRYERILYVVRDPRDVAISEYHFHRKCRVIDDNLYSLGIGKRGRVVRGRVGSLLKVHAAEASIVFIDPPYDEEGEYETALDGRFRLAAYEVGSIGLGPGDVATIKYSPNRNQIIISA